jgi:hypothetical protein
MSFFVKKTAVLVLAMAASLGGMNVYAATAPAAQTSGVQKVSTLGGKLEFNLPASYVANPLPAGDEASGTAGAAGTMYVNKATKSVVIAVEHTLPSGVTAKDNDAGFLDGAVTGFLNQQVASLPDFKKLSEKKLTLKGLGVRQIDSTATMGGGKTLNTTFLAGSGSHMSVVQVIFRADDQAGHDALIKQIVGGK